MIYPLQNKKTLQTTVQLLVDAVNQHYDVDRVLADFGIKILGRVNYTSQIPGYITGQYDGHFGDAYLVSQNSDNSPPYDVYIWTRLEPDSVEPDGYWLDIGVLATVGPKGDRGDPGPEGPQGENTRWYIFTTLPESGDYKPGDVALLPDGNVYMYVSAQYGWSNASQVNIKGAPGSPGRPGQTPYIGPDGNWWIGIQSTGVRAEGRDGANGTPGTAILIQGKLNSVDLLPDPATAPRNYGYLITVNDVVRLYFIAGVGGEENWQYIEYSGNGTIVTTDGTALDTWDTNTKVDKTTLPTRVYSTNTSGVSSTTQFTSAPTAFTIMYRYTDGRVQVGTPVLNVDATNKQYVDDGLTSKVSTTSVGDKVYGTDSNGNQKTYTAHVQEGYGNDAIPLRAAYGNILVPEDTAVGVPQQYENKCATSKKYVDDAIASVAGGDYEIGIVTVSAHGEAATLNVSDLVDIVPNTTVQINVDIDMSDITLGPPGYACYIGNTDVGLSENQYYGFPVMTNNYNLYSCHVTCTGTSFKAVPIDKIYGSMATGTTFRCGVYSTEQGTNTITATYIKHK